MTARSRDLPATPRPGGGWVISPWVKGISDDTRRLRPGELFVAVRGVRDDGHRHLAEAWAKGAAGAVVERPDPTVPLPQVTVGNSRRALAELAATWYGEPSRHLTVVGITGTNGKTTTAHLVRVILDRAGHPAATIGTLGPFPPDEPLHLTTPGALQLQALLASMARSGQEAAVVEVSSHGLVQHRVHGVAFDVAVLTGLGRDHLDFHRTLRAYWAAKRRLFKALSREVKPNATAVLPASRRPEILAVERHLRVPALHFGQGPAAQVRALGPAYGGWEVRFDLAYGGSRRATRLALPGRHNLTNALAAAAAALALGVDLATVAEALAEAPAPEGRGERVPLGQGGYAVIDYAHNPGALAALLEAVRHAARDRPVVAVFGGRGHRDPGKLPLMGRAAARAGVRALVLTTDSPMDEDPAALAGRIAAGVPAGSSVRVIWEPDRAQAIARALALAGPGGWVVITGRGHERRRWLGDRAEDATDRELLQQALGRRPPPPTGPWLPSARPHRAPPGGAHSP